MNFASEGIAITMPPPVDLVSNDQTGETHRLLMVELRCAKMAALELGNAGSRVLRAVDAAIAYHGRIHRQGARR